MGEFGRRQFRCGLAAATCASRNHSQSLRLDVVRHRLCRDRYRSMSGEEVVQGPLKGRRTPEGGSHGRQQHEVAAHFRDGQRLAFWL